MIVKKQGLISMKSANGVPQTLETDDGTSSATSSPADTSAGVSKATDAAIKTGPLVIEPTQAEQEKRSIETLSSILFDASKVDSTPANLVSRLSYEGYVPVASRDYDEATGSMITIATKNTLPGTRYFTAQFFSDETGMYNPQDIAVELRPGTPIPSVVASLNRHFALGKPNYEDPNFMRWSLPDHKSLTIQKLNERDIREGDPNRARSMDDIGTLVVAVTADPAGHEEND